MTHLVFSDGTINGWYKVRSEYGDKLRDCEVKRSDVLILIRHRTCYLLKQYLYKHK